MGQEKKRDRVRERERERVGGGVGVESKQKPGKWVSLLDSHEERGGVGRRRTEENSVGLPGSLSRTVEHRSGSICMLALRSLALY